MTSNIGSNKETNWSIRKNMLKKQTKQVSEQAKVEIDNISDLFSSKDEEIIDKESSSDDENQIFQNKASKLT